MRPPYPTLTRQPPRLWTVPASGMSSGGTVQCGDEVWVREDGCVFGPLACSHCRALGRHHFLGVSVPAGSPANRHLMGKVGEVRASR